MGEPFSHRFSWRVGIAAFALSAILILLVLNTAIDVSRTLTQLNLVESDRDQWQRPSEIIAALNLHPGSVVADVGCGSGYFTLKLSNPVSAAGKVLAVDIRRLPLVFLWMRTIQRGLHNVELIHGEPSNPKLPLNGVDAVLIVNTFHELTDSKSVLGNAYRSLRSNGRLVMVDRSPGLNSEAGPSHEVEPGTAEIHLRESGFIVVERQEKFIDRPGDDPWWLIVAAKAASPATNP